MKLALAFLLIGVAAVASDDMDGHDEPRFPDYVRVEVEIQRLENPGSVLASNAFCDLTSSCDPYITAYLDVDSPLSPFPGKGPNVGQWPLIFKADNNNSPTIAKSVNRDVCGGSVNKVNLRVHVADEDNLVATDVIGDFECVFVVNASDIAADALAAKWGPSTECTSSKQVGKIRLFARERTYQIPSTSCNAIGTAFPSGDGMHSDLSADPGAHVPGQHDTIRIEAEIIQLFNPQGLLHTKQFCDNVSPCDPRISVFIDTDKPLSAWPGAKIAKEYAVLFEVNNENSPVINKITSKDICGGSVSKVNLRVDASDVTLGGFNALIEDFECPFTVDYRLIPRDVSSSDWSPAQDCKPQSMGADIRLQFRYRIYDISRADCGIKA